MTDPDRVDPTEPLLNMTDPDRVDPTGGVQTAAVEGDAGAEPPTTWQDVTGDDEVTLVGASALDPGTGAGGSDASAAESPADAAGTTVGGEDLVGEAYEPIDASGETALDAPVELPPEPVDNGGHDQLEDVVAEDAGPLEAEEY